MSVPLIVYKAAGATLKVYDSPGREFRLEVRPGCATLVCSHRDAQPRRRHRAPARGNGRFWRPRLEKGTPEHAAEVARLDRELDEYMAEAQSLRRAGVERGRKEGAPVGQPTD